MDASEGQAFVPGMVLKVDDPLADYMLETWGFLTEMSVDEAKKYLDSKEEYKCEKCEFKTKVRVALEGHKRKHLKESQIDDLGIPTLQMKKEIEKEHNLSEKDRQAKWDEQDKKLGLIGEGLTEDHV
jgi:hypothetical protein